MKKLGLIVALSFLVEGCAMLDDYMLGKDNTPAPATLATIKPKVKFSEQWSKSIATAKSNEAFAKLKPAFYEDMVFSASSGGVVEASAKSNGRQLWRQQMKSEIVSGPAVNSSVVIVADAEAKLIALSSDTGQPLWQASVSNQVLAQPVIKANRVYAKTIDGKLYAFDLDSGKQVWRYSHGAPNLILRASSAPLVVGNVVLAGFADGKLDAINRLTGQLQWQRNVSYSQGGSDFERMNDIDATPLVKGGTVYVSSFHGEVAALSLKDGRFLWKKKISTYKDMAVNHNQLFVVDANSQLWALNRHNGMVLWHQKALHDRKLSAPVLTKNGLVVADGYGYLHMLSASTGEEIGRQAMTSASRGAALTVVGNNIYLLSNSGALSDYSYSVVG